MAERHSLTQSGVRLIRIGIDLSHSRRMHPQTHGKDERLHRTLKAEVISRHHLVDIAYAQRQFDAWRHLYNHRRPHEALRIQTPAQRYSSSKRSFPSCLPPIKYESGDWVRKVDEGGWLRFRSHAIRVSKALRGHPVALRANPQSERRWDVYFCHARTHARMHACIARLDRSEKTPR